MLTLSFATSILGLVIFLRLIEFMLARANAERLIADGAIDLSGDPYLIWMALQGGSLFAIAAMIDPDFMPPIWAVLMFAPLPLARGVIIARWRRYWLHRLLITSDGGLINPVPKQYRVIGHMLMAVESAALPLVLGQPLMGLVIGILHGLLSVYRLKLEADHEKN